ncbi:ArnT family glycosyltransferase [Candidatus Omnitrophota bacterium]
MNKATYYKAAGLVIIFLAALAIRLYPVINSPEKVRYGLGPFGDTHLYHRIAYNLYKGNGFSGIDDGRAYGLGQKEESLEYEPAITRGPAYPLFMYFVYKYFGHPDAMKSIKNWHKNWDKIRIVQCILDATICLLVFFIVKLIYPAYIWPALISAFLYCFSFYNIFYTKALLSESVSTFLVTLSIFFCILGLKDEKKYWLLLAGIGFGLVALSRPEYILFLFILPVLIFFVNRQIPKIAIKKSMIFLSAQ